MEPVFFNNKEYQEILQHLEQLTKEAEQLPYPQAKELVFSILKYFDVVHREALSRILNAIKDHPKLLFLLEGDYTVKTLLDLYDLSTAHQKKDSRPTSLGFVPFEQVKMLTPLHETIWIAGGLVKELEDNQLYTKRTSDHNILICKSGSQIFAFKNACVDSILPLETGYVDGRYLICPWHGCRYDLKSGNLLDKPGIQLETYQVELSSDGTYRIGITSTTKNP